MPTSRTSPRNGQRRTGTKNKFSGHMRLTFAGGPSYGQLTAEVITFSPAGLTVLIGDDERVVQGEGDRFKPATVSVIVGGFQREHQVSISLKEVDPDAQSASFQFGPMDAEVATQIQGLDRAWRAGEIGPLELEPVEDEPHRTLLKDLRKSAGQLASVLPKRSSAIAMGLGVVLLAVSIAALNAYAYYFPQSVAGYVDARRIFVNASASGFFEAPRELLKPLEPGTSLQVGEVLGRIRSTNTPREHMAGTGTDTEIIAPCDCDIVSLRVGDGSYITAGETVFEIAQTTEPPLIKAEFRFADVRKLLIGDNAQVTVLGTNRHFDATVSDIKFAEGGEHAVGRDTATVILKPHAPVGRGLVSRPVSVVIDTLSGWPR